MKPDRTAYEAHYEAGRFWRKVQKYAKVAGVGVLTPALKLYYAAQDSDTPKWARVAMLGALGYFISPLDGVPDIVPIVGYGDDLGVLLAALATTAAYIKEAHVLKAHALIEKWFG
ncbi:MAG: DUF1232 domain-containing protein [Neisseriaceae bacterium]|nr:DUF1232 domain-containing protein [Neisseriaceae bacterium]